MLTNFDHIKSIDVLIPVYKYTSQLQKLIIEIEQSVSNTLQVHLIIVDDSDEDSCWSLINTLALPFKQYTLVKLTRNYGQHNAILCGIQYAKYSVIVTLDDDGQHNPIDILNMVEQLKVGYDVVYGYSVQSHQVYWKQISTVLAKRLLVHLTGVKNVAYMSAFRAFKTELLVSFRNNMGLDVNIDAFLLWNTRRIGYVVVNHRPRREGASGYTIGRLINHFGNLYIGSTTVPLRIVTILGLCSVIIGALIVIYVIGTIFWIGRAVPGFAFTASSVAIFSGIQMLSLGIVGEYLARTYKKIYSNTSYVVRSTVMESPNTPQS